MGSWQSPVRVTSTELVPDHLISPPAQNATPANSLCRLTFCLALKETKHMVTEKKVHSATVTTSQTNEVLQAVGEFR